MANYLKVFKIFFDCLISYFMLIFSKETFVISCIFCRKVDKLMQNFNVVLMIVFILPYMLYLHFIFEKPAMKIKIDTHNFLIGMYTPLWVSGY